MGCFWDVMFLLYFITHIPVAILIDCQAILPAYIYPDCLQNLVKWYCTTMRDPMMMDPPYWFQSFICSELLLQLPFFFVAAYAFWKGYKRCPWIRIPAIVYCSHVITTLLAIVFHVCFHDFTHSQYPGPETGQQRLTLLAIYFPYLIIPVLLLIRMLFYAQQVPVKAKEH